MGLKMKEIKTISDREHTSKRNVKSKAPSLGLGLHLE